MQPTVNKESAKHFTKSKKNCVLSGDTSEGLEKYIVWFRKTPLQLLGKYDFRYIASIRSIPYLVGHCEAGSDMTGFVERRKTPRFPITLPVKLERGAGTTHNVSTSGVFFETDQTFSAGTPIRLTLLLGSAHPSLQTRLRCHGRVLRVEGLEGRTGVAVAFKSYWFEGPSKGSR